MADFVKKTWACDDVITADELNRMEDGIEEALDCCEGSGGASMQSVTYSELKTMRDNGTLTAGSQYRITDYECTTTQEGSRAVANSFDIIVVADDENTLNENARACLRDGDTYYTASNHSANLEAWELKYCIDNDTTRFGWADATNGKGVIYWLKDERNNECPYDFKQIQFSRGNSDESGSGGGGDDSSPKDGGSTKSVGLKAVSSGSDTSATEWLYTFSVSDSEASEKVYEDASIATMDDNGCYCYSNIIKACTYDFINESEAAILMLNDIVFSNTFGDDCSSNTFGNDCYSNTFGDGCFSNTFGDDCSYIDFFLTNGSGMNYNLLTGVFGSDNAHYVVSGTQNNQFATYVGKNSSGVIKTWVPADLVA